MSLKYRARKVRASPWWQCLQSSLGDFFKNYPTHYAEAMGSLRPPTKLREDGMLLVFDGDPPPPDDKPVFWTD